MRRLSLNGSEPVEETGDAMAVVRVLSPFVARVIIANPLQVKASGHVKTDKIDAGVLRALAREFPERRLVGRDGPSPVDPVSLGGPLPPFPGQNARKTPLHARNRGQVKARPRAAARAKSTRTECPESIGTLFLSAANRSCKANH